MRVELSLSLSLSLRSSPSQLFKSAVLRSDTMPKITLSILKANEGWIILEERREERES